MEDRHSKLLDCLNYHVRITHPPHNSLGPVVGCAIRKITIEMCVITPTEWCKVGIGICYDMRFQEMASIYNQQGCQLLIYPGAFNMITGPAHWELLAKGRQGGKK